MLATGTQRDKYIDELVKTDALLDYAIQNGMHEEAKRLRAKLHEISLLGDRVSECASIWNGAN